MRTVRAVGSIGGNEMEHVMGKSENELAGGDHDGTWSAPQAQKNKNKKTRNQAIGSFLRWWAQ